MTDILCRWLNEDVKLEPKLTGSSFAEQSSNGYLFAEVLHRHGLQDDFQQFSNGKSSQAKLNNFIKLEPTFRLLEIPFNINMAQDIMNEKPGVATRLMYQLFVALERKKQRKLTGQSLECMRPSAKVKLEKIETGIFQQRLKHQTPRQVDLSFDALVHKFQDRQKQYEELLAHEKHAEAERVQFERKEACHKSLEKSRQVRERQTLMYSKLKPIAPAKSAAAPQRNTQSQPAFSSRATARSKLMAADTRASIDAFEVTIASRAAPPTGDVKPRPFSTSSIPDNGTAMDATLTQTGGPSADYVAQIKRRVEDNAVARQEREKRRRKVLVEQMQALREQEDVKREKLLVERLMRQCQQERRIATQLMHIRKQKDTIRNNRIHREKQYEAERIKEFEEALNREAELARQEAGEKQSRLKHHVELYRANLASKAELNYRRNYQLCREVLLLVVDFATKMAEYRNITENLVPAKIVRDWKTLFVAGLPLYAGEELPAGWCGVEEGEAGTQSLHSGSLATSSAAGGAQGDNQLHLDDTDFQEYKSVLCEWEPPESLRDNLPSPHNPILTHIVYRLLDEVAPPKPPPTPPSFPRFLAKASFIGKPFTGKSTALQQIVKSTDVAVLSVEELIMKAVNVFLSEKRHIERIVCSVEEDPVITEFPQTPTITVEPSSSLRIVHSEAAPPTSERATPTSEGATPSCEDGEHSEEVNGHESKQTTSPVDIASQLSPLAVLGWKAHTAVASGETVDERTVTSIIEHELRCLPDGSSWILDNYPATLEQAQLLSEMLTGQAKPLQDLPREFELLAARGSVDEHLQAASGLDLVVYFSASTEVVLQRASQQDSGGAMANTKLEQLHHRLLAFDENWSQLKRWYHKFRTLSSVNANQDLEVVCGVVQDKVQEVVNKTKQADAMKKLGLPEHMNLLSSGSSTKLDSLAGSIKKKKSPKLPKRKRRPSSAGFSIKALSSPSLSTSGSPVPPQSSMEFVPSNPNAEPGSAEWQYCRLPLGRELAEGQAGKWPGIEETYLGTLKGVFRELRGEREAICQYFYLRRNEFAEYLRRPDHKQEFVSQWQESFNSLQPHLRCEDIMKAELHHRVDDLCDKLWDISDGRRDQAQEEQRRISDDQWLQDHIGLLSNHYLSLMQVELDLFQDTMLLLKDYYSGMEGNTPAPLPQMTRLPLIELAVTEKQEPPASATSSVHSIAAQSSATGDRQEDTTSPSNTKRRVPVIPRQPPAEPVEEKGGKKKGGAGGGGAPPSPPPPAQDTTGLELDSLLIVTAYNTAIASIFSLMNGEVKVLDAAMVKASKPPSAKPVEPDHPPEVVKDEKGKKGKSPAGKKGKSSPAKGKGAAPPVPPPETTQTAVPTLSPEEIAKRQIAVHMCKEHKAAIQMEETRVKLRLELIKLKATELFDHLKHKNQAMRAAMEEWVGQCYKKEVECVDSLAVVLRQAIENEKKLTHELVMPGAVFQIKENVLMFVSTPPPTPPPVLESSLPEHFTVAQLTALFQQLLHIAPSGFMLRAAFIDTLLSFAGASLGRDLLPDCWAAINREQVEQICDLTFGSAVDYVDWRLFLVGVAQPWPALSAGDVVEALDRFTSAAPQGLMGWEQYLATPLWSSTQAQSGEGVGFDRNEGLKEAFFAMFSDPETNTLNYKRMLLYLCADHSAQRGLLKALSMATGVPVSTLENIDPKLTITLEGFHQVLCHGVYPNGPQSSTMTTSVLYEVFVGLSPSCPNEAPLRSLLQHPVAVKLLSLCTSYSLPDLSVVFRPQSRQTETE